ncbi:SPRY domain-containing protein 3 [Ataeniobius toweri]|uniref:SPRY domain-containing protein 3 n=1 Tax=Ataeniobius toweri TaxID=208326 RepID=A0ABU7C6A3_9TELE|nr:SPRY domain-containing protein 3 [Ataeniobius toweri]
MVYKLCFRESAFCVGYSVVLHNKVVKMLFQSLRNPQMMDDINVLHHRCLLNLRRRIRDIGDGRPAQERCMRLQKDGDTLSYQGNSEEVGCYVAGHPLSKGNCYFEVRRGTLTCCN